MSHTKEEEETENIKGLIDHLDILDENIKTIKTLLLTTNTLTKKEIRYKIEQILLPKAKLIVKRLKYMLKEELHVDSNIS